MEKQFEFTPAPAVDEATNYLFDRIYQLQDGIIAPCECVDNITADLKRREARAGALEDLANFLLNEARGTRAMIDVAKAKCKIAMQRQKYDTLQGYYSEITPNGEIKCPEITAPVDNSIDEFAREIIIRDTVALKIKQQIQELSEYAKSLEQASADDRSKILDSLIFSGEKKRQGKVFSARVSSCKTVNVYDEDKVPSEYLKCKFTPKLTEIKDALKNGEDVAGCELVEKQYLTINK